MQRSRFFRPLAAAVATAGFAAACQPSSMPTSPGIAPGMHGEVGEPASRSGAMLQGRVVWQGTGRQTFVTAGQVVGQAAVTLLDPATGDTLAGGRTDAAGKFELAPSSAFSPQDGGYYYLRVVKQAGPAVGSDLVSVATVLRWSAAGWASITNGTAGSGEIVVNPTTTAAVLIEASDTATAFADIIGVVSGAPTFESVTAFKGHGSAEVQAKAQSVAKLLVGNADPLGHALLAAGAALAPDDSGDPTAHHDHVVTRNGVQSTFVWIPIFEAYQLINPANCGSENSARPVGTWVAKEPQSGVEAPSGTAAGDWARERFGGFYAGKYEATRADATPGNPAANGAGATAGTSSELKVARYCVPWANLEWQSAALTALSYYPPYSRLMQDDEWAALAIWSSLKGLTVYGNGYGGQDFNDRSVKFIHDPTQYGRALTGSGSRSTWTGDQNLTTHTGTTAGVWDLNGNVYEWTTTLGMAGGKYLVRDATVPVTVPHGSITQLSTDPRLRRFAAPGAVGGSGDPFFSSDVIGSSPAEPVAKTARGGAWSEHEYGGLWSVYIRRPRTGFTAIWISFRPTLRF